jgi:erythronate-4-phosphate dehydrogenase
MIKIVADQHIPFLRGALEGVAEVHYLPGRQISNQHLKDADALIIRTRTRCDEQLLHGTPVRFIASATIGHDHIDADYCKQQNITWTNAPGCNAGSVCQYLASALAYIIQNDQKSFEELSLGIVGAGHTGSKVACLARKLGIRTLINDPPRERQEGSSGFVTLSTLLQEANIISMHVPLQLSGPDKTFHMADEAFFKKVKKNTWFINTSRGETTDTNALINALKQNHLQGAIIDVWENEPEISPDLLWLANIATPHIAGYSTDGKANGTSMSVQALSRFFGLAKDNWTPQNLPLPPNDALIRYHTGTTREECFCKLAMHTYNIESDSIALKAARQHFEGLREQYPIRREPQAYSMAGEHIKVNCREVAMHLGFGL